MTTIDHRILIPAAPNVVWDYVSDITHNPDWQVDCTDVIFLTSRREGPGLRWRYATPEGHEMVVAVTAWYNGLGYEYYFVDGTSFKENKGRIRLQEIPEGTVVQWTFTYELGGLLGGVRNSLGMSRQVDQTISDSLKVLWQKIKAAGGTSRTLEPKSLMRDAPDVEARSAYQPRHPSVVDLESMDEDIQLRLSPNRFKIEPPIIDEDAQNIPVIEEPPVVDEDTRPRPAYTPPPVETPAYQPLPEPDFLDSLAEDQLSRFEPPAAPESVAATVPETPAEPDFLDSLAEDDLSRFEPPRPVVEAMPVEDDPYDTPVSLRTPIIVSDLQEPAGTHSDLPAEAEEIDTVVPQPASADTLPEPETDSETVAVAAEEEFEQVTTPVTELDEETLAQPEEETVAVSDEAPASEPEILPAPPSDAASIWEIFGVPRPSETQETSAVAQPASPEAEPADTSLEADEAEVPTLIGIETQPEPAQPEADTVILAQSPSPDTDDTPRAPVKLTASRLGLRIVLRRRRFRLRQP